MAGLTKAEWKEFEKSLRKLGFSGYLDLKRRLYSIVGGLYMMDKEDKEEREKAVVNLSVNEPDSLKGIIDWLDKIVIHLYDKYFPDAIQD